MLTRWEVRTYDVWGNADDVASIWEVDIETDGDSNSIYVNRESDGFPIGEMRRID